MQNAKCKMQNAKWMAVLTTAYAVQCVGSTRNGYNSLVLFWHFGLPAVQPYSIIVEFIECWITFYCTFHRLYLWYDQYNKTLWLEYWSHHAHHTIIPRHRVGSGAVGPGMTTHTIQTCSSEKDDEKDEVRWRRLSGCITTVCWAIQNYCQYCIVHYRTMQ